MKHYLKTLENGLDIIFIDTGSFPTITSLLLVGAGSRYETKETNGIAHFFEHIPFKGTTHYPSAFDISATIEGKGGNFNAFTAKDHTGYWIKVTNEHFDTSIDLLADMVLHPLLDPEEIEREKGVIVEEINMYEDTPSRRVGEVLEGMMYAGNPLGFDILGTKKTVTAFTKQTFVDYMNRFYYPNNAVLVIAGGLKQMNGGGFTIEEVIEKYTSTVEKKFNGWKPGKKPEFTKMIETQTETEVKIRNKKTEQVHFAIGFRAFPLGDPRRRALSLLGTILGGGSSSRLFIEVRERRGLCYYIGAGKELYQDTGNLIIQAGVTNQVDKVKESIAVTLDECKKIAEGKIKEGELRRAQELLKGRLLLSFEDSSNVATYFAYTKLLENRIETPAQAIEKIQSVTAAEVIDVAKTIFTPANLNFAAIAPFEKDEITTNDLKL